MADKILFYLDEDKEILNGLVEGNYIFTNQFINAKFYAKYGEFFLYSEDRRIIKEQTDFYIKRNYKYFTIYVILKYDEDLINELISKDPYEIKFFYSEDEIKKNPLLEIIPGTKFYFHISGSIKLIKYVNLDIYYLSYSNTSFVIDFIPNVDFIKYKKDLTLCKTKHTKGAFHIGEFTTYINNIEYSIKIKKINDTYVHSNLLHLNEKIIFLSSKDFTFEYIKSLLDGGKKIISLFGKINYKEEEIKKIKKNYPLFKKKMFGEGFFLFHNMDYDNITVLKNKEDTIFTIQILINKSLPLVPLLKPPQSKKKNIIIYI